MVEIQTPTVSDLRTFTFNAKTFGDGSTSGQMELVKHFNANIVPAQLDCLNVVGNTATMSGVVTSTNNRLLDTFSAVVFTVVDNGAGANAPPDFPADQTIVGGNVQVRG